MLIVPYLRFVLSAIRRSAASCKIRHASDRMHTACLLMMRSRSLGGRWHVDSCILCTHCYLQDDTTNVLSNVRHVQTFHSFLKNTTLIRKDARSVISDAQRIHLKIGWALFEEMIRRFLRDITSVGDKTHCIGTICLASFAAYLRFEKSVHETDKVAFQVPVQW